MGFIIDFYERLVTYADLTALVGDRIWAVHAPPKINEPYCVFSQVSGGKRYSHAGYSNIQRPRMQVSCYATTYEAAKEVALQVTAALESWPGVNIRVGAAFQQNELDFFEEATGLYHVPVDFFIWYQG